MSDSEGLRAAYGSPLGWYLSPDGHTLFVRGTDWGHGPGQLASDVRDDMMLPMSGVAGFGGARNTHKYALINKVVAEHQTITRLVGHSLGASVSKALAEDHGLEYNIYGSPSVTWQADPHSHRQFGDPISVLDRGAVDQLPTSFNPHSYS